jgi:DtxR family Mn-dependent transcriptional regulator
VTDYQSPEHRPAFEEYCEAIFELDEDDISVIQARIADRLGVSRPAVSEAIRRMRDAGLVSDESPTIQLTPAGHALAERVVRRHRLAERFLTDVLGLSWAQAHHEAGRWEHILSENVEAALSRLLGEPTTCPHGNPIPGSAYQPPDAIPLADLAVGAAFVVRRIPEALEFIPGMLDHLEQVGMQPDRWGTVVSVSPDGTVTVAMGDKPTTLGPLASRRILVSGPGRPQQPGGRSHPGQPEDEPGP